MREFLPWTRTRNGSSRRPSRPARSLGPAHEDELIAGFLDRIDREIDRRVEQKLERRGGHRRHGLPLPAQLGPMIPIVIFAGVFGGTVGIVFALAAVVLLVLVNELRR